MTEYVCYSKRAHFSCFCGMGWKYRHVTIMKIMWVACVVSQLRLLHCLWISQWSLCFVLCLAVQLSKPLGEVPHVSGKMIQSGWDTSALKIYFCQTCWCMPIIPELRRLRLGDGKLEVFWGLAFNKSYVSCLRVYACMCLYVYRVWVHVSEGTCEG